MPIQIVSTFSSKRHHGFQELLISARTGTATSTGIDFSAALSAAKGRAFQEYGGNLT